jgi:hypothetical protein
MNEGVENMRTAVRTALGVAVIVLVACGASTESRVLGKWTDSNTGAFIEFFDDGKLQFGDKESSVVGNWSVSDGRVKIELSGGANSFVATLQDNATLVTEVAGVAGATFKKQ